MTGLARHLACFASWHEQIPVLDSHGALENLRKLRKRLNIKCKGRKKIEMLFKPALRGLPDLRGEKVFRRMLNGRRTIAKKCKRIFPMRTLRSLRLRKSPSQMGETARGIIVTEKNTNFNPVRACR